MKINPAAGAGQFKGTEVEKKIADGKEKQKGAEKAEKMENAAREKDPTYTRTLTEKEEATLQELREEAERAHLAMRRIVEELLKRQGYTVEQAMAGELDDKEIEVDEQARTEAEALVADDGPLGAEAVSNRIIEYARTLSGDDPEKLEMLRGAIELGFREAERMLGGLPEVSQRTYDMVMEKLDGLINSEETEEPL